MGYQFGVSTAGRRNRRQRSLCSRASRAADASVAPGEVVELEHVEGTHRSDLRLRDALLEMCCLAEPERQPNLVRSIQTAWKLQMAA